MKDNLDDLAQIYRKEPARYELIRTDREVILDFLRWLLDRWWSGMEL